MSQKTMNDLRTNDSAKGRAKEHVEGKLLVSNEGIQLENFEMVKKTISISMGQQGICIIPDRPEEELYTSLSIHDYEATPNCFIKDSALAQLFKNQGVTEALYCYLDGVYYDFDKANAV